jgi:hemolysin activation/secretion protein
MNHTPSFKLALSFLITGLCCTASLCNPAFAQVPGNVNPGLLEQNPSGSIEEKQEQKAIPTDTEAPKVEIQVEKQPGSVQIQEPKFQANKIVLENVTIFTDEEMREITQPYEGKELTLDDLQKIVEAINTKYREKGYLTSQAYVPPQDVNNGVINIQVVEGHVGKLCVTGNQFYRTRTVLRDLDLKQGAVLNIRQLEHDLNASNRFNNFHVKANLSPGEKTGETDIRIDETEKQPWQISPTFDNQGRPFIGFYRGGVAVRNDSLLGFGDQLNVQTNFADGTTLALGSYFVPIGSHGDQIGINYGYSRVDLDLRTAGQPNIDGIANTLGFSWIHPFDEDRVWTGDLGFEGRRIVSRIDGVTDPTDPTSRVGIRAFTAGLNFNKFDKWGRTFARLESSTSIAFLGGNTAFWKANGYLNRFFSLPWNNTLMIRAFGQYSPTDLPSAEAMQIGGAYSVRGYTEGLIIGDRGFNITVEDRWPIPFLSHVSPWLNERLQGAVFYDFGRVWTDKSNINFVSNQYNRTALMSVGVGLRARLTQYLQGFLDLGYGLHNRNAIETPIVSEPTFRIHFGVRSDLLPEVYKSRNDKISCIDSNRYVRKEATIQEKMYKENIPASGTNITTPTKQEENAAPASESESLVPQQDTETPKKEAWAPPQRPPANETTKFSEAPQQTPVAPVNFKSKEPTGRIGVMNILNGN